MDIKKIILPIFFGLSLPCYGVVLDARPSLEGDYEMPAPKRSAAFALMGALAGGALGAEGMAICYDSPGLVRGYLEDLREVKRRIVYSDAMYGGARYEFIKSVARLGAVSLSAVLGGYLASYLSAKKTSGDYKKYKEALKSILEVANDEIVTTPLEDFYEYSKDKEALEVSVEDLAERLDEGLFAIEILVAETCEKSDEWYDLFRFKAKRVLDDASIVVEDLVRKKNYLIRSSHGH